MTDGILRIFSEPDDLDPGLYACSKCGKLWGSFEEAGSCCRHERHAE